MSDNLGDDFKCPHCASPYFGPHWEVVEGKFKHVGRACKGKPTTYDRSYHPCPAKYVARFSEATERGSAS